MNSITFKNRVGLLAVLIYLGVCFALMIVENNQPVQIPEGKEINILKALQVISSTLLFILPATLFCRYLRPERTLFLNLNFSPHIYFVITALACIFFAFPAVSGLESWNQSFHLPANFSYLENWMRSKETDAEKIYLVFFEDKSIGGLVINLLVMALIAALSEEIFFRGVLQQMFIKNKMNAHVAIIVTAILFSAFHLQFFGFIPRMFLGIILGYLYYITQNLWVSIIAHFFNNAFAVVAAHFYTEDLISTTAKTETPSIGIAFILLSIAMVTGQLIMLSRFVTRTKTLQ